MNLSKKTIKMASSDDFVRDLHRHMLEKRIDEMSICTLFNYKSLPDLAFDTSRYPDIEKPYRNHFQSELGKRLFRVELKEGDTRIIPIHSPQPFKTLYSGRNIQVTLSKASHERVLASLDRPLSAPRAGTGAGGGSPERIEVPEASRKRSLEDPAMPVPKRVEQETEIDRVISMLQEIQELERAVAQNQERKTDLEKKIEKQNAQLAVLSSLENPSKA